ncbi:hypothetical protein M404DRAFT_872734, partial [Pisolithus tinctorius Marx 270]
FKTIDELPQTRDEFEQVVSLHPDSHRSLQTTTRIQSQAIEAPFGLLSPLRFYPSLQPLIYFSFSYNWSPPRGASVLAWHPSKPSQILLCSLQLCFRNFQARFSRFHLSVSFLQSLRSHFRVFPLACTHLSSIHTRINSRSHVWPQDSVSRLARSTELLWAPRGPSKLF